jgi:hypothetical protein
VRIAIIGTRRPSPEMAALCRKIAVAFRDLGLELVTGNADGIDSIARDVWNERWPERVTLVVPWFSYNMQARKAHNRVVTYHGQSAWAQSVRDFHPAPDRLSEAAFKLHARNYGIVELADAVIAFPNDGREGGGTGQGILVARALGKPLFILHGDLERLRGFYRSLRYQPPASGSQSQCDPGVAAGGPVEGGERMKFNNPWVRRDYAMSRLVWGQEEVFPNQRDAEAAPTMTCACGREAYYHPAVGSWRCPACGRVKTNRGWI